LQNNSIKAVKFIAEALDINQSLTTLNLDHNPISDEGAKLIAEALKSNQSLTTLNLSDNSIGDKGAQFIAEALKINQSLTALYLTVSIIHDDIASLRDIAVQLFWSRRSAVHSRSTADQPNPCHFES